MVEIGILNKHKNTISQDHLYLMGKSIQANNLETFIMDM